jgi:hypothetical protein
VDREDAAGNRQNVFCAIVCVRAKVLYYWYSLVCLVQALLPPLLKKLIGIPTGRSHLGLPPGGVAVTEVGLSPGREHNGAVLVTALGEGEREGGGAAHDLWKIDHGQRVLNTQRFSVQQPVRLHRPHDLQPVQTGGTNNNLCTLYRELPSFLWRETLRLPQHL